ncbi:MAG: hypothetical protein OEW83_16115 [Acidimicrobiia bacterium]|nr:hypothetical protein [Acidimicrobiia bacterium]
MYESTESTESTKSSTGRSRLLSVLGSAVALTMLLAMAGCGGSSDDDSAQTDGASDEASDGQPAAADTASDDTASADTASDDSGQQDASGNYARVTIGSETFEIPPDGLNLCNSLENIVFGSFAIAADGSPAQAGGTEAATQINFGVPVTNWEEEGLQPPLVNLDLIDEGMRWFASVDRGLGSVDSWELADGKATGEATFEAEEAGSGSVIGSEAGSFEIVCR